MSTMREGYLTNCQKFVVCELGHVAPKPRVLIRCKLLLAEREVLGEAQACVAHGECQMVTCRNRMWLLYSSPPI